jgi:protoporphyrin/coproporphyrin ferrochelatase
LYNLFADPDIIRLPGPLSPLQAVIAYFIAKRRAPKSREAYDSIGGGSPILSYSNAQANLIAQAMERKYDLPVKTYIGMRYWHPFTEEALEQIRKDQIEALVIVPLYPQFSISTSGSSLRVLQEEFSRRGTKYFHDMVHTVVPSWYQRPGYVRAITNLIETELDSFTDMEMQEAKEAAPDKAPLHVLFSAHGVPQSYIAAGDPYQKQIEASVAQITNQLRHRYTSDRVEIHLSYQSRVGPIEWLRPYTDSVLPTLGQSGVRNLVVVPISFVSEHVETLEEIDIEYRELAHEHGVTNWRRCPALNTDATFIDDMADMVFDALNEPAQTVTEACVANNVGDVDLATPLDDDTIGVSATGVGGVGADGALYATSSTTTTLMTSLASPSRTMGSSRLSSSSSSSTKRRRAPSSTSISQTRRESQQQLQLTPLQLFSSQVKAVAPVGIALAVAVAKAVTPLGVAVAVLVAMSGPSAAQWMGL